MASSAARCSLEVWGGTPSLARRSAVTLARGVGGRVAGRQGCRAREVKSGSRESSSAREGGREAGRRLRREAGAGVGVGGRGSGIRVAGRRDCSSPSPLSKT